MDKHENARNYDPESGIEDRFSGCIDSVGEHNDTSAHSDDDSVHRSRVDKSTAAKLKENKTIDHDLKGVSAYPAT